MIADQQYIDRYIQTIPVMDKTTDTCFVIGMIGVVGAGKSTVATMLAERLDLYVASNDRIRRWLNDQGIPGHSPRQELLEKIALTSSRYLLERRISYILDNDLIKHHQLAREIVAGYGGSLVLIRVVASEETIVRRIKDRSNAVQNGHVGIWSRAGVKEFQERIGMHNEKYVPHVSLTINTEASLEPEIDKIVEYLQSKGLVKQEESS